jgi:hypothetical protein
MISSKLKYNHTAIKLLKGRDTGYTFAIVLNLALGLFFALLG